ncbi:AAA family ATPase [Tenacibaculum mesophilum]|uniref:AAA family ATPase n=1 Tax=Tenacibaculum mesophilum TaxID=104268 RepID=UPI003F61D6B1
MRINKIKVENLFETFTHEIKFNHEENLTLILGQNGLGKTMILRIIKAIFEGDFITLLNTEFSKIIVELDGDTFWEIYKRVVDNQEQIHFTLLKGKEIIDTLDFQSFQKNYNRLIRQLRKYIPYAFRRVEEDEWFDRRTDTIFSTAEIFNEYKKFIPEDLKQEYPIYPDWISSVIKNQEVALIETQRLLTISKEASNTKYRENSTTYKNTVQEYSDHLVQQIRIQLAESSELSTKLDRTYPNRLIERLKKTSDISQEDLNDNLSNLEKKRERLHKVGLLDLKQEPTLSFIREQDVKIREVLLVYIEDSRQKLDVYDELADKIELFLKIINERFLKKKLTISRENGLIFNSEITGNEIPLKSLSSGEQHILVLYYQLLFKLKKGTLLLMDEPEISLHLSWQKKIIDDLKEILKLNPMDVVIATHSPAVIGNKWNLTVELNAG